MESGVSAGAAAAAAAAPAPAAGWDGIGLSRGAVLDAAAGEAPPSATWGGPTPAPPRFRLGAPTTIGSEVVDALREILQGGGVVGEQVSPDASMVEGQQRPRLVTSPLRVEEAWHTSSESSH